VFPGPYWSDICEEANPKLVGTALFDSINGYLGVGECIMFGSCYSKADSYPSAVPLR